MRYRENLSYKNDSNFDVMNKLYFHKSLKRASFTVVLIQGTRNIETWMGDSFFYRKFKALNRVSLKSG